MPPHKPAKLIPYLASQRAHSQTSWLNSHRSFNFPNYYDADYEHFGPIRILNEDRVSPMTGFPSHPHRDAEIFSYILSGELTHRDSTMQEADGKDVGTDMFYRMKRGDVQFTSAGSGVAHSEKNEHKHLTCNFLQIWVLPWKKGLEPVYHHGTVMEEEKRRGFVTIISPLKGGRDATPEQERAAEPAVEGTIPIHADFLFGASIIPPGKDFVWNVGGDDAVSVKRDRKVYVYLPSSQKGQMGKKARIQLNSSTNDWIMEEGDGLFVSEVDAGDELFFESVGNEEAEVVVLDANPN